LPMDAKIPASASRTPEGGVLYLGEYKRALLQSAPFIALCALFALQMKLKTTPRDAVWLCWLALVPLIFIGFFSLLRWHGGFAYHMRYYLPVLPFMAMICAQAFAQLVRAWNLSARNLIAPWLIGIVLSILGVIYADGAAIATREWMLLSLPLWFWAVLVVVVVVAFVDGAGLFMRQLAIMVCGIVMMWGGASSMLIVYAHLNQYKKDLHLMSASYAYYLKPRSIVISVPRYFTSFYSSDEFTLHVATIYEDGEKVTKKDMREMMTHFLKEGYGVYITHDMKSLPYLQEELESWGMRLTLLRGADPNSNTPALSEFTFVTENTDES